MRRLRYLIKHGRLEIVIFGPGGTGKSTLGNLLIGTYKPGATSTKYQESISIEKLALQDDVVGQVLVAPGQRHRRKRTWDELYQDVASGKHVGIINVVSWGYHSFTNPTYRELSIYEAGMTSQQVMDTYLKQQQGIEMEIIRDLVPHLCAAKGKLWMVTLITKEDLWWKQRVAVEHHYRQGKYAEHIQDVTKKLGERNFTHEYVSASLVMSNMTTTTGEPLALTSEGYDQNIQADHLQRLLDAIDALAKQ